MGKDILYQSETADTRIKLSGLGVFVVFLLLIWVESWLWKITSFTPIFFFLLFSSVVLGFLGTALYYLIKYAFLSRPALVIFQDKLWVGDEVIPFKEIEDIVLINDKPSFSKWSWPEESVTIKLKSGKNITIVVSRYTNGNLFRTFCEQVKEDIVTGRLEVNWMVPDKVLLNPVEVQDLGDEKFQEFRPNPFASILFYQGLLALAVTIFVLCTPIKDAKYSSNIIFALLFFSLFLVSWVFQKYFLVSNKFLVIRYRLFFWVTTIMRIEDICKIEKLRAGRAAKLSITTKDYVVHNFLIDPVGSTTKVDEMIQLVNENAGINHLNQ